MEHLGFRCWVGTILESKDWSRSIWVCWINWADQRIQDQRLQDLLTFRSTWLLLGSTGSSGSSINLNYFKLNWYSLKLSSVNSFSNWFQDQSHKLRRFTGVILYLPRSSFKLWVFQSSSTYLWVNDWPSSSSL